MKIAIIGTRGIPNYYGGFEQFAEKLSVGLVNRGHKVSVYNSSDHPFKDKEYKGVQVIHCYDPEKILGTSGQFIYDLICIINSRNKKFDIILQLGYTSSSIWSRLFPKKSIVTTNMDGLEWMRAKYSKKVQKFLKYAESLAIKHSDYLISDSLGIKEYLQDNYNAGSVYIPYGADEFNAPRASTLVNFNVKPGEYNLLIARFEPENSIQLILDGVTSSALLETFLVVGNYNTKYGVFLTKRYESYPNIKFIGAIYNQEDLNNLRYHSKLYFHGHTVGGTNPSLLEAMASSAIICAHDNLFNQTILNNSALYFKTSDDVKRILNDFNKNEHIHFIDENLQKVEKLYRWDIIIQQYEDHFTQILQTKSH